MATPSKPKGKELAKKSPPPELPPGVTVPVPLNERFVVTEEEKKMWLTKEKITNHVDLAKRPGYATIGRPMLTEVNCYKVLAAPTTIVYQWDVKIRPFDVCITPIVWFIN
jgi:hypothetical protein